jgi:hypothetical protein
MAELNRESVLDELLAMRQFKTNDEIIAALQLGVEFYVTIVLNGRPAGVGHKRRVLGPVAHNNEYGKAILLEIIPDTDQSSPYCATEYIEGFQRWPAKALFLKRADAEAYLAKARELYDRVPDASIWAPRIATMNRI